MQWDEINELREKMMEVEARKRCLFDETHIPKEGDNLQNLENWVRAVVMSIDEFVSE